MDAFPTVDQLLAGIQSKLGATDNWDVVASYSLDKLNALLKKAWVANSTVSTTFTLKTESLDENDETYYTDWTLQLGAPSLQFTLDNRASLLLALSGTWQNEGTDSKGNPHPVKSMPEGKYCLQVLVPLAIVSADRTTGKINQQGTSASVISFDDNANSDIHIVFDFRNDSGLAAFSVIISPTYTGDDKSLPDLFTDALQRKLMARMQDPTYVSSIQLALATVQNHQVPSALYLTPESVAFSVYTNSTDGKTGIGCLSVYIKTVDSGFDKGNASRSFTLPATGNKNSYPIPQSYTASLIIRHDLFAKKFLSDSLASVMSADNKKTFKSVSINTNSDTGFSLNCYIDSTGVGNFSNTGWWGGLTVADINWDFGRDPLTLQVDAKGNASWSYQFDDSVSWSEDVFGQRQPIFGVVNYHLRLSESQSLIQGADSQSLSANINLQSSQFVASTDPKTDWPWYDTGATSYVPSDISNGLSRFTLPQCIKSLNLNYFATTNIFAPGKKFIDIKGPSDVYTPYDVLILGQVADDFTSPSVTLPPKFRSGQKALKDINAFVQDINAGKPVLAPALASLQTGDEQKILDFIAGSGYDITPEALDAVLASTDPGPNFDIRMVPGVYTFDTPADTGYIMTVDPSTGRISINNTYVGNSTDNRGHVLFEYQNYSYDVTFTPVFGNDGSVQPVTFSGSRVSDDGKQIDNVSGKQTVYTKPQDFYDSNGGIEAAWYFGAAGLILGAIGAGTPLFLFIYRKIKKQAADRKKALAEAAAEAQNASKLVENLSQKAAQPDPNSGEQAFNVKDYRGEVERAIDTRIQGDLRAKPTASVEELREGASEAAETSIEQLCSAYYTDVFGKRLGVFKDIIGNNLVDQAVRKTVEKSIADTLSKFTSNSEYIQSVAGVQKTRAEQVAARGKETQLAKDAAMEDAAAKEAQLEAEKKTKAIEVYVNSLKEDERTKEELAKNTTYQKLQAELEAQEALIEAHLERRDAARDEGTDAEHQADEYDNELREQEKIAKEKGNEAFE